MKELLLKFLRNDINKQKLKSILQQEGIPIKDFNTYIFTILKGTLEMPRLTKTKKTVKNILQTNEFLDYDFLKDVKTKCANRKMETCQGLFKLTKPEIQMKMTSDRKLQALFSLKRNNPFDIEQINVRVKRTCVEYGLNLGNINYGSVVYEGVVCFIRNMVDAEKKDEEICEEIKKMFPVLLALPVMKL